MHTAKKEEENSILDASNDFPNSKIDYLDRVVQYVHMPNLSQGQRPRTMRDMVDEPRDARCVRRPLDNSLIPPVLLGRDSSDGKESTPVSFRPPLTLLGRLARRAMLLVGRSTLPARRSKSGVGQPVGHSEKATSSSLSLQGQKGINEKRAKRLLLFGAVAPTSLVALRRLLCHFARMACRSVLWTRRSLHVCCILLAYLLAYVTLRRRDPWNNRRPSCSAFVMVLSSLRNCQGS
jgi:hypothetical protein